MKCSSRTCIVHTYLYVSFQYKPSSSWITSIQITIGTAGHSTKVSTSHTEYLLRCFIRMCNKTVPMITAAIQLWNIEEGSGTFSAVRFIYILKNGTVLKYND